MNEEYLLAIISAYKEENKELQRKTESLAAQLSTAKLMEQRAERREINDLIIKARKLQERLEASKRDQHGQG